MMPQRFAIVLGCFMLGAAGCDKAAAQRARPELALASARLMPAELPHFEPVYFEDQTKVKVITGRTVSYEPLESFRAAKARAASESGGVEKAPAKPRGVFGRSRAWLVEKLGGSAPAGGARTGRPAPPADDSAKDEADESDAGESGGDAETTDDESEDDEEEVAEDEEDSEEDEDWGEDEDESDEDSEEEETDEEDAEEDDTEDEEDSEEDDEETDEEDSEEGDEEEGEDEDEEGGAEDPVDDDEEA